MKLSADAIIAAKPAIPTSIVNTISAITITSVAITAKIKKPVLLFVKKPVRTSTYNIKPPDLKIKRFNSTLCYNGSCGKKK